MDDRNIGYTQGIGSSDIGAFADNLAESLDRQMKIAFEPEEIDYVPFLEKKVGPDGLVFGTDYSHPDCISPRSVQNILDFPELSDESKKRVLSDNPARLWDINVNGNGH